MKREDIKLGDQLLVIQRYLLNHHRVGEVRNIFSNNNPYIKLVFDFEQHSPSDGLYLAQELEPSP